MDLTTVRITVTLLSMACFVASSGGLTLGVTKPALKKPHNCLSSKIDDNPNENNP